MQLSPLVSIIIPVFNGQSFIRDAYRLLIDQKLDNFEIIFVDNNSTDSSVEIINNIIKTDARVLLYQEFEQGAAAARNAGLKYAKGEFIYFFDVDDELFDNALNALLEVLISNEDLDSVHGNMVRSTLKLLDTPIGNDDTNKITFCERYYWGMLWMTYATLPNTGCFLHRKNVFDKISCFNTKLKLGEDAAFHVKLGMECQVAHLDKNILLYFRHEQSTVSAQNKKQSKVFTYWEPLIHSHIPYLLTHDVPLDFRKQVLVRVYGSIPHMLFLTKGYAQKKQLKNKLFREIKPLRIPVFLRPFINIVMLSGNGNVYKVYAYFVLRYYMKYAVK
ncbi:glycosyltransferase family 2 protein [Gelidibacter sp. DF109]|uniref:Glycosyltransferase family 2 protein n=2 Tax=Gelidibacter pelagius TaxID=2819985 RepID=A0ABS3SW17_9FLAO|nr:glycosyltransferase family 2 protein [Gelidibacter pelagius]